MRFALLLTIIFLATLTPALAQAPAIASSTVFVSSDPGNGSLPGTSRAAKPGDMVVLSGKITKTAGVLPGAVVILTNTKQMAVTNADGEFEFVVPASAGILSARVTYAGYADEILTLNTAAGQSTMSLTNAQVIVVAHRQQLKHYLKTAHKQIKHDLKQVRR